MMTNDLKILMNKFVKVTMLLVLIMLNIQLFAQTKAKPKTKTITKKTVTNKPKVILQSLPHTVFFQLIDSTDKFVINHQTEFVHIDVPKKFYTQFTSYIKDSVAAEIPGIKSLVYYNYTLVNGKIINGDIFWNDTKSYIAFSIDGKKYVNYFTKDGVAQLKTFFKLQK